MIPAGVPAQRIYRAGKYLVHFFIHCAGWPWHFSKNQHSWLFSGSCFKGHLQISQPWSARASLTGTAAIRTGVRSWLHDMHAYGVLEVLVLTLATKIGLTCQAQVKPPEVQAAKANPSEVWVDAVNNVLISGQEFHPKTPKKTEDLQRRFGGLA